MKIIESGHLPRRPSNRRSLLIGTILFLVAIGLAACSAKEDPKLLIEESSMPVRRVPNAAPIQSANSADGKKVILLGLDGADWRFLEPMIANGLTPTQMALAYCYTNWRVASTIIGVTTLAQLDECLDAWGTTLSPELLTQIDTIRWQIRDPAQ